MKVVGRPVLLCDAIAVLISDPSLDSLARSTCVFNRSIFRPCSKCMEPSEAQFLKVRLHATARTDGPPSSLL